jgi:hypothetical protein
MIVFVRLDLSETGYAMRWSMAVVAGLVAITVALLPAAAFAAADDAQMSPLLTCGSTTLTGVSGSFVERSQMHRLQSGLYRVVGGGHLSHVTAQDENGNLYRVVGAVNFSLLTDEGETGHFTIRFNVIGPHGLFGTVRQRAQLTRSGRFSFVDRSTCELAE